MNINIELIGVKEALDLFDPKKVIMAANSALNKVAAQAKTEASKEIREAYNVPAGKLSEFLRLTTRASGNRMEAIITGKGIGIALSYFGAKQEGISTTKKQLRYTRRATAGAFGHRYGGQVSVEVKRGARKPLSGQPKPFMVQFKSGHIAVVQRIGKERKPIKQLLGPGIGLLFGSKKIMDNVKKVIQEKWTGIFTHELDWRINKK
jgi:hypothetical protein